MVVIRLARAGSKKKPFFHLSVMDKRNARDGRFIERVGFYNPIAQGQAEPFRVNLERIDYWSSVGAQLSPKVKSIVQRARVEKLTGVVTTTEEIATSESTEADPEPVELKASEEAAVEEKPVELHASEEPVVETKSPELQESGESTVDSDETAVDEIPETSDSDTPETDTDTAKKE